MRTSRAAARGKKEESGPFFALSSPPEAESLEIDLGDVDEFPISPLAAGCGRERNLTATVAETEKQMLVQALEECNWNMTRAAEVLGITFRSMRYNVKKYGLSREGQELTAGARR